MTVAELKAMNREWISAKEAAEIMGCPSFAVTVQAKNKTLPFPFYFSGNRVKIPRRPFLKFFGIEE